MNEDPIVWTLMFAALAVILPLAFVHGGHKAQELEDAWRKLADRHRLRFERRGALSQNNRVTGILNGHSFLLQRSGGGNKAAMQMELSLIGALPAGLRIKPRGKHAAAHVEILGVPVSHVVEGSGEVRINDEVSVKAKDPGELPGYLTPERKRAALSLADLGGELEGHKLRVAVTKTADDLEHLDRVAQTLAAVGPILDTAAAA